MHTHTSHRSRSCRVALVLAAALVSLPAAQAEFTGDFASANWTLLNGGGSSITFTDTFTLTIVGPNDKSGNAAIAHARITLPEAGTISFAYSAQTNDTWGYDPVGYYLNGTEYRLSPNNSTSLPFSGSLDLALEAGDIFSFFAWSQDSKYGASILTVTDFTFTPAAIPEPSSFAALAGLATLGLGVTRRRRAA